MTFESSFLPETKTRKSALVTSFFIQACLVTFVFLMPVLFSEQMIPRAMYLVTTIAGPPLDIPKPVAQIPKPPKRIPAVEQPAPKLVVAKMFVPKIEAPKVKPRQVDTELPKVNDTFKPPVLNTENAQPSRPREPVKVGTMGSSAVATIVAAVSKVQTGGFGDPNGVTGPSDPSKRANIGQFGNPALPAGPGYGNGSGGASGQRGIIASTGFGNGVAIAPSGNRGGSVKSTGFSDSNNKVTIESVKKIDVIAAIEAVTILSKPKPVYSAEAIKLNLEGEVLLDVVFLASGEIHVNQVVKGLGHGLDESAIRAAEQIKYKPALSNGHPVDFPAVIHIVFQMAY
jgi:TonB family protein